MKPKTILAILLFCIVPSVGFSQKNRVEIYLGSNKFYNVLYYSKGYFALPGIGISRKVSHHFAIEIKYFMPGFNFESKPFHSQPSIRPLLGEEILDSYNDTGKLFDRINYHYFDAGARYEIFLIRNQSLSLKQSISLAYGTNSYLDNVGAVWTPNDPFHTVFADFIDKKEAYFGGVTGIAYDYRFWKNRINIGLDVAARYYTTSFPFQLNYGLRLGYNF